MMYTPDHDSTSSAMYGNGGMILDGSELGHQHQVHIHQQSAAHYNIDSVSNNTIDDLSLHPVNHNQPHTSRGVCLRAATCLLLIVLPIFVASTFITYFLMKNTSLGKN